MKVMVLSLEQFNTGWTWQGTERIQVCMRVT